MKFSELAIGQVFNIVKDNKILPLKFKKTEINDYHNCLSLWKENHQCKAHCSLNQEVSLVEELEKV